MKIFPRLTAVGIIIICSVCFIGCTKETTPDNSYGLPNATESGAQTFGCLISGYSNIYPTYIFVADNDFNDPNYTTSGNGAWLKNDTLTIAGAPQIGSYFQGIQFTITGNLQQGATYNVDSAGIVAFISSDSTCQGIFPYSPTGSISNSGTIQLTKFDTVNKIVSGNFNCVFSPLAASCGDDTLYVTQGRFDYKYH